MSGIIPMKELRRAELGIFSQKNRTLRTQLVLNNSYDLCKIVRKNYTVSFYWKF